MMTEKKNVKKKAMMAVKITRMQMSMKLCSRMRRQVKVAMKKSLTLIDN